MNIPGFSQKDGRQISDWDRWWVVVIYAMAMAWVESAVVFYLRTMIDRIEPYQPNPLPMIGGFAPVELTRELATLVMLFTVGMLAGRTWRARIGYAVIAFGVWDIFYYVFLKMMCGWPHTLLDWDILFLLPMPWWGPVLAPVMISVLMIVWGTFASQIERNPTPMLSNWRAWILNFAGVTLALYVFMADTIAAAQRGLDAIRMVLPEKFNWSLFGIALLLMSAPVLQTGRQFLKRQPVTADAGGVV
ncbi:MAG: hypothetical protein JF609_10915 [Verrucomicrobia bacterium]|nr:hypothetical protein [Verrucomicrobiota bacterium]